MLAGPPRDPPEVGTPLRPGVWFYAKTRAMLGQGVKPNTSQGEELGDFRSWKYHNLMTLTGAV